MKYCDFLNNYLIENNLSKYALAKKLDITPSGLNFIMNDSSKFPSAMMIEKISKLLNIQKEKVLYLIDAFDDDFENYEESDKALICASLNHRVFCKDKILEDFETYYAQPKSSLSSALRNLNASWCETKIMNGKRYFRHKQSCLHTVYGYPDKQVFNTADGKCIVKSSRMKCN